MGSFSIVEVLAMFAFPVLLVTAVGAIVYLIVRRAAAAGVRDATRREAVEREHRPDARP